VEMETAAAAGRGATGVPMKGREAIERHPKPKIVDARKDQREAEKTEKEETGSAPKIVLRVDGKSIKPVLVREKGRSAPRLEERDVSFKLTCCRSRNQGEP